MKRLLSILCIVAMLVSLCSCSAHTDELTLGEFYEKIDNNIFQADYSQPEMAFMDFGLGLYTDSISFIPRDKTIVDDASISGASACINVTDNCFISAKNIYERIYPASVTKLMTALLVLEKYNNLDEKITVTESGIADMPYGSRVCGFEVGDTLTMRSLLASMMVYSGNDAAYIIANHISTSTEEFVNLMNSRAQELLAVDTHFVNPHGLHNANHYSTLYDMYLIFNECLKYDLFREMISYKSVTVEVTAADGEVKHLTFEQTNLYFAGLHDIPAGITVNGGKTGSTNMAGMCMILNFTGSDGKDYIAAVFNAPSYEELYNRLDALMEESR